MAASDRELYAKVGVEAIPKIVGLLDRNRLSPTYGCFDKGYWHYKTASFPSGMYQEFVLPLALVYRYKIPGAEVYFQEENIRQWVIAGILYALKSSHRDGSCDDYFPYERALGAVAFSLYACTESALLLGLKDEDLNGFFTRRGLWLVRHDESGRLSNHQALAALALYNVYLLTGDGVFQEGVQRRLERLLSWQSEEGWFPEYEGCDPGYNTATIDFLAKYHAKSKDEVVLEPLGRAIAFSADFIHPDGSFGGEYGSRNTHLFFPHGFELMAARFPKAASVADLYLKGVRTGKRVYMEDDRLVGHLAYNHLQAYLDFHPRSDGAKSPENWDGIRFWKGAGLYVRRKGDQHAVISVAKGGVVKLFDCGRLVYSDSGLIARSRGGRCLVSHLIDRYEFDIKEDELRVKGNFGYIGHRIFTPLSMICFYLGMISVGRFFSNRVRLLLQRLLIVGKKKAPLVFQRTFSFGEEVILVDEIWDTSGGRIRGGPLVNLYAGTDHTSIYVAASNAFQQSCLRPWYDYSHLLPDLRKHGYVKIRRVLKGRARR